MEITHTLHKYQTHKNHGDSKTQSLTRPTTHTAISTSHNSISSQKHNFSTSLAAPKANPIFHAANKNLFIKIYFDLRHLTSSSSSFYVSQPSKGNYTISEETTQRKHTYVTTIFLATNKPTSPAKIIQLLNPAKNASDYFWSILHELSISLWVA